jgi:hypothetical protein
VKAYRVETRLVTLYFRSLDGIRRWADQYIKSKKCMFDDGFGNRVTKKFALDKKRWEYELNGDERESGFFFDYENCLDYARITKIEVLE